MEDIAPTAADFAPAAPPQAELAALIASRICHDLNNPLGAIGNGLELMELAGHKAGPELALIAQSVAAAKSRVQFLRIAFGAASPGQTMGGAEVAGIVAEHFRAGRVSVTWPSLAEIPRDRARIAFLVLMCLETALPFGGQVSVAAGPQGWAFTAEAERLRALGDLWDVATGAAPRAGIAAPLVQFAALPEAARQLGVRVQVHEQARRIRVEV